MRPDVRTRLDRIARRDLARLAALGLLATVGLAALALFATAGDTPPKLGPHLGADYAGFYAAGVLVREAPASLYDLDRQETILRRAVPILPWDQHLPYLHAAFLAPVLGLLACLPYKASFATWLLVTAGCYGAAVGLTLRTFPAADGGDRSTAWLLALAFQPFLAEAWLGGQAAALGALAVAGALALERAGRPAASGAALSLLLYKPSLPGLVVLLLVAGRRWRTLLGFLAGAAALAGVSLAVVGAGGLQSYRDLLLAVAGAGGSSSGLFRAVKYVDLASALCLAGLPGTAARLAAGAIALPLVAALARLWWKAPDGRARWLAWGATFTLLPALSPYAPVYDATVAFPGILCGVAALRSPDTGRWPGGFAALLAAGWAGAWLSPALAAALGVQLLTPCMVALGVVFLAAGMKASGYVVPIERC